MPLCMYMRAAEGGGRCLSERRWRGVGGGGIAGIRCAAFRVSRLVLPGP